MWHSPRQTADGGRRYTPTEIAALLEPLGLLLDALNGSPPSEVVTEPILQRMETDELTFAMHEVFDALLSDRPVPPSGHPGYHEAGRARRAAWRSYSRLCGEIDGHGRRHYPGIERLELIYEDPHVHLCRVLTAETWQEMLLGDAGSVASEFLWDRDWRIEEFLDHSNPQKAWMVAETADIDLHLVHRLPKVPSRDELARARMSLRRLVDAHERASE
jgi:hypothetical protein